MAVKRVSPAEADQLVRTGGYVYVDVRSIPEFEAGHPAGAYNIPILHQTPTGMQPNAEFVDVVTAVFPLDSKLVLGCRSGNRSLRAAEILLQVGYADVVDQRAGTAGARDAFGRLQEAGWEAVGLEIGTEAHPGRAYEALRVRIER
jgi:rhodanese-related sulfurtransferase